MNKNTSKKKEDQKESLEVCPEKKRDEMLGLLNRFNSEDHFATAYMEEDGGIVVRWNLLCEEENLIPTACEALAVRWTA